MPDADGDREARYRDHVAALRETATDDKVAMQEAVGGDFDAIGLLELDLLIWQGLLPGGSLVDVGCGSGRLTAPLASYLTKGTYLGTDIVEDLLDHARGLGRPGWRFEAVHGFTIPAVDAGADMVCFFSVLTHLLHEEGWTYLQEARRVLKPGGRIVVTFLEFDDPEHWHIFEQTAAAMGTAQHHNQFLSRDAIRAFANHLSMEVGIFGGGRPNFPIRQAVTLETGERLDGLGRMGQSVAVFRG